MLKYTLPNPLTIEEKLELPRLTGHDTMGLMQRVVSLTEFAIKRDKPPIKRIIHYMGLINDFDLSILYLSQLSEFDLSSILSSETLSSEKINIDLFDKLKAGNEDKLITISEEFDTILTETHLVTSVLYNLIKNAIDYGKGDKTTLEIKHHKEFPEKNIFLPEGARNFQEFIGFHVKNKGIGFPNDENWKEYFSIAPEKGKRGFGLYFTGLVAKVLQAPINISSKPEDTDITFYHPIYVKK